MGVGSAPDRDTRADDRLALEEIRRLYVRDRQVAHHGMVIERDEIKEADESPAPAEG